MKILSYFILGVGLLGLKAAYALECEVSYKAKKTVTEHVLLQSVKTQKFRSGKVRGKVNNNSLSSCNTNALQPLVDRGWIITSRRAKKL